MKSYETLSKIQQARHNHKIAVKVKGTKLFVLFYYDADNTVYIPTFDSIEDRTVNIDGTEYLLVKYCMPSKFDRLEVKAYNECRR